MAATEAQIAYLTLFQLGNASSPETFASMAEVTDISGFGFSLDQIEATHMESPNGYKEYVAGMKDGDTMTVTFNMIRENAIQTKGVWDAGLRRNFQLNFPGTLPDYDFSATPEGWHVTNVNPNNVLKIEAGLKIAGAITGS